MIPLTVAVIFLKLKMIIILEVLIVFEFCMIVFLSDMHSMYIKRAFWYMKQDLGKPTFWAQANFLRKLN